MKFEFTTKDLIDWGSAGLVFVSGAIAGHYAAIGMTPVQMAGAAAAIVGSVALAVAVRVWPGEAVKAKD